ncbi:phosphonoacetaldehyde reductase [Aliiglaciecola lipolytica]|uniref:phosphonoacetaldehyde reductase n=1 Tax=Aliiglaciecola lipolytica TaxID=477689 RepID=UPI001C09133E|nr:phosphonoacetaldehyde reductase [Aliiglaciecola lipolytica]MBU2877999.1 phosphonoacetaldehyde reductase [Aliiglaciecola lipolytica]
MMTALLTQYSDVNIIETDDFLAQLPALVCAGNILLVTSKGFTKRGVIGQFIESFGGGFNNNRVRVFDDVTPNPEKTFLENSYSTFADENILTIIALGGGSVIDTAKVFAAMLSYKKLSLEQLLTRKDITCQVNLIAVPTTSGTGAEVTPFATVWESESNSKHSLYGIRPRTAILDPNLTLTLPYSETLYPALDALSHGFESLWNKSKTQLSQEAAISAIELICEALPEVEQDLTDVRARKKLQCAATLAGLAISTTKTAIAHAISYPLTSKYAVPHGLACSFSLLAIIDIVGQKKLDLPSSLFSKVSKLLQRVNFTKQLSPFIKWSEVQDLSKLNFDQSRTGNFIVPVDRALITKILLQSQKLAEVE